MLRKAPPIRAPTGYGPGLCHVLTRVEAPMRCRLHPTEPNGASTGWAVTLVFELPSITSSLSGPYPQPVSRQTSTSAAAPGLGLQQTEHRQPAQLHRDP